MMRTFLTTTAAAVTLSLATIQMAYAAPVLFAVQAQNSVAEDLAYGPTPVTAAAPGVFTGVGATLHNQWFQQAFDSSGSLFDITWDFSSIKTVAQRFDDAVSFGEAVTWTVTSPLITGSQVFTGIWRWSNEANLYYTPDSYATRFTTSGSFLFSNDDGVFGAGNGVIDAGSGGDPATVAWGFGNFNGGDSSALLRLNGVNSGYDGTFRSLIFVNDSLAVADAPELDGATAVLPIGMAVVSLLLLSDARRRRRAALSV